MNNKTLKVLEYNKIIEMLMDKAESQLGKDLIKELKPLVEIDKIESNFIFKNFMDLKEECRVK